MEREELIAKLTQACDLMLEVEKLGDQINEIQGKTSAWQAQQQAEIEALKKKAWVGALIGGAIGIVNFSFLITAPVGYFIAKLWVIPKRMKKRQTKLEEEVKQREQEDEVKIAPLREQTQKLFESKGHVLEGLPEDYCYSMALEYMKNAVANLKADNLKEAVNLYDTQLHHWKMEAMQADILDATKRTAAMQESIEKSARATAIASSVSAAVGVVGMFQGRSIIRKLGD